MSREEMIESLCSFSGQEEDIVEATLEEAEWNFEKASLQLYEDVRLERPRNANTCCRTQRGRWRRSSSDGRAAALSRGLPRGMTFSQLKSMASFGGLGTPSKTGRSVCWLTLVGGTGVRLAPRSGADAQKLPRSTPAGRLLQRHIYAVIRLGRQTSSSHVVPLSANPRWKQHFSFWMEKDKEAMLSVKVFTQDNEEVGSCVVKVRAPPRGPAKGDEAKGQSGAREGRGTRVGAPVKVDAVLDAAGGRCTGTLHLMLRRSLQHERSPIEELLLEAGAGPEAAVRDGALDVSALKRSLLRAAAADGRPPSIGPARPPPALRPRRAGAGGQAALPPGSLVLRRAAGARRAEPRA